MEEMLRKAALDYHRLPKPGKIAIAPIKGLVDQRDLLLAHTPGVAAACEEIVRDPSEARKLTSRGNQVAVVTNGTAALGQHDGNDRCGCQRCPRANKTLRTAGVTG